MASRHRQTAAAPIAEPACDGPTDEQVQVAVTTLTLLADPTRLRVLWLLARDDHDVGTLATLAGTSPSAASQHLAKLRLGGLVAARKQGQKHVYSARGGHIRTLVTEALFHADHRVHDEPDHS